MAKRSLVEELDRAVESIIRNPDAPLAQVDSQIAPLIQIAVELRDLVTDEFQARLKHDLLSSLPAPDHAETPRLDRADGEMAVPLERDDRTGAQPEKPASWSELKPRDIAAALEGLGEGACDARERSMTILASLNQCVVGVARYSDQTPRWERNPEAEELLHVLDGELDVTTLTDSGPVRTSVPAGSILVCRPGLWHWPRPQPTASLLIVRPEKGTEYSLANIPRDDARRKVRSGRIRKRAGAVRETLRESEAGGREMTARNVRAALSGIPVLAISESTTGEEAGAAFPRLGSLNQCGLYAGRFSGLSPWERHTSADELLHVLEGELEIITLTDAGPLRNTLRAGNVFVCPRGLWHRQYSASGVLEFSATPQPTEVSLAADPRM